MRCDGHQNVHLRMGEYVGTHEAEGVYKRCESPRKQVESGEVALEYSEGTYRIVKEYHPLWDSYIRL